MRPEAGVPSTHRLQPCWSWVGGGAVRYQRLGKGPGLYGSCGQPVGLSTTWWIESQQGWEAREWRRQRCTGERDRQAAGCEDREAAAALRGRSWQCRARRCPKSDAGEYYWADLLGLCVRNVQDQALGKVADLLETGGQQLLVVQGERERLIPFVAPSW